MAARQSQIEHSQKMFVLDLYENLLSDFQHLVPDGAKDFKRDFETIKSRVAAEGLSFLTKVLPRVGKAFDKSLDTLCFEMPIGLKRSKSHPAIPALLQGMLKHIFRPDGSLREDAKPEYVRHARQFWYLVYKLELPYSKEQEDLVIETFLENEENLKALEIAETDILMDAARLIEEVLSDFDPKDILPKHGPGAVATGEKLDEKWEFSRLYDPIHQCYPYYDYYVVGGAREIMDRVKWYRSLDRQQTGQAKVVLVPKDSRGPRLISCEPLEYQWIQQGFNRKLVEHLESHKLTGGHINFKDQTINQRLAMESSKHHAFCTLDLKDASDLVSVQLVKMLFPKELIRYLLAIRSHETVLPDHRVVVLHKYAPMGSAVCFSIEALVFWAICTAVVSKHFGHRQMGCDLVFVYGDDIIVPTVCFDEVVEALSSAGLKVNADKSFYRGDFRESCGVDAFKGVNVTPVRVKRLWSRRATDGLALSSYVAYANKLLEGGYYELGERLMGALEEVYGVIPHGTPSSAFPCRRSSSAQDALSANVERNIPARWNPRYQRYEVRVKTLVFGKTKTLLDCWNRLLRNLSQGVGLDPNVVVLPKSTKVKRRWCPLTDFSPASHPRWVREISER